MGWYRRALPQRRREITPNQRGGGCRGASWTRSAWGLERQGMWRGLRSLASPRSPGLQPSHRGLLWPPHLPPLPSPPQLSSSCI